MRNPTSLSSSTPLVPLRGVLDFEPRYAPASDLTRRDRPDRRLARAAMGTLRAVGEFLRRLAARAERRRQARATYFALRELDDHTLRDLGFDRSEILSVTAEITGQADATRVRTERTRSGLPR